MAHIESLIQLQCCSTTADRDPVVVDIDPASGGQELLTISCHMCGGEYMFGVITRTREQSLASDKFDPVADEVLAAAGVDTEDYNEPDDPEVRMCAGCDVGLVVNTAQQFCSGCGEYICPSCRTRSPRAGRHQADEHWQAPKYAEVVTLSGEDDGSVLTGDDAIFTAERED
jgi:hypothetical protein